MCAGASIKHKRLHLQSPSLFDMLPGGTRKPPPELHLGRHAATFASPRALTLSVHNLAPLEAAFIIAVLNDARSWAAYGFSFALAPASKADFAIFLTEADDMAVAFPGASLRGMSVTDRRGDKPVVHLNAANWRAPPAASGYLRTLAGVARYRAYVVNHEVGHVLGLDHAHCSGAGAPAPIMQQQTRGTGACRPDPWVVKNVD